MHVLNCTGILRRTLRTQAKGQATQENRYSNKGLGEEESYDARKTLREKKSLGDEGSRDARKTLPKKKV